MFEILLQLCVWFAWAPGANAGKYELILFPLHEIAPAVVIEVIEPSAEVCVPEFDTLYVFTVIALSADGITRSIPSNPLLVEWQWNFDLNGNGIFDFPDLGLLAGKVNEKVGTCNDGKRDVPCP